jgi:hypothetical protein
VEELKGKEEKTCKEENGNEHGKPRRRNAKRTHGCESQE